MGLRFKYTVVTGFTAIELATLTEIWNIFCNNNNYMLSINCLSDSKHTCVHICRIEPLTFIQSVRRAPHYAESYTVIVTSSSEYQILFDDNLIDTTYLMKIKTET